MKAKSLVLAYFITVTIMISCQNLQCLYGLVHARMVFLGSLLFGESLKFTRVIY